MIRVALIGTGQISLANHLPGIGRCRDAAVTALCDTSPEALAHAARISGIARTWTDPDALIREADVDAVIIATPNVSHRPIALAAIARGLHVLCEKPLAMTLAEAVEMAAAADAAAVSHMTAFTYRFVPAMRYLHHLVREGYVGEPWHFRAQRFMDWGRQALGWRQQAALAGSGQVGDMLSHRIDFGHLLVGDIAEVMAHTTRIWDYARGRRGTRASVRPGRLGRLHRAVRRRRDRRLRELEDRHRLRRGRRHSRPVRSERPRGIPHLRPVHASRGRRRTPRRPARADGGAAGVLALGRRRRRPRRRPADGVPLDPGRGVRHRHPGTAAGRAVVPRRRARPGRDGGHPRIGRTESSGARADGCQPAERTTRPPRRRRPAARRIYSTGWTGNG